MNLPFSASSATPRENMNWVARGDAECAEILEKIRALL
jgi:hypothetical protein